MDPVCGITGSATICTYDTRVHANDASLSDEIWNSRLPDCSKSQILKVHIYGYDMRYPCTHINMIHTYDTSI